MWNAFLSLNFARYATHTCRIVDVKHHPLRFVRIYNNTQSTWLFDVDHSFVVPEFIP
jgi:hypothetical protein